MAAMDAFDSLRQAIIDDSDNSAFRNQGYGPVYAAGPKARVAIISQAPGIKAQLSGVPWDDVSGRLLRKWLDVSDEDFYDPDLFAIVPMDFYYPGKGSHGDLPPRKDFAAKWHAKLFDMMPNIELGILVGAYAQKYYLGKTMKGNLTATVTAYQDYLPRYFPLVHPSPLNLGWRARNKWFEEQVLPDLKITVKQILQK